MVLEADASPVRVNVGSLVIERDGDVLDVENPQSSSARTALSVVQALGEGVCLADLIGQLIWTNPAMAAMDPQLRERIASVCKNAATMLITQGAGRVQTTTTEARPRFDVTSGDDTKVFEVLISPVFSGGQTGELTHLAAVVSDVTPQRRREQRMDAIDRAGAELVRLDVDQIKKMNTVERLGLLEQKVIRFAHDLLHFDHFAIRLIDKESEKLELVMSCGLPAPALAVELFARSEGNGISGFVAATGRSYICVDTNNDPRYVIGVDAARSSLTVPLRLSDRVIGVFNVESTSVAAFTEEDRQFSEMFATYIALALHILNLLVVERSTTGQAVTGTVEGELNEPLDDIAQVAKRLKESLTGTGGGTLDSALAKHIERIVGDVDAIRKRVKNVSQGAATVLGTDEAIARAAKMIDPVLRGKRIMVADDDQRIRQLVSEVFRARGAEVVVCEDGASAIATLERLASEGTTGLASSAVPGQERSVSSGGPSARKRVDLLVSDIRLPDKTGYEIFSAARGLWSDLPVILMTGFGYDPHHSIVRASQQGLSAVLFKPFQAERLIEEAHKALLNPAPPMG